MFVYLGKSVAVEKCWIGVVESVVCMSLVPGQLQLDFVLCAVQVLKNVRSVVQSHAVLGL